MHDKLTDAYWNVFTRIESVEFMDQHPDGLLHTAEMLGMNDDFRDNLRICARKDIDEGLTVFHKRKQKHSTDALIGAFTMPADWGNETIFQETAINHIVARKRRGLRLLGNTDRAKHEHQHVRHSRFFADLDGGTS
ncbi:MAG: hypothetical protein ACLSUW_06045 [Akkermansia sp.]